MIKEWQTIRCQKERTTKLLWSKNDRQYDVKKKEQQSYYDQRMTDNTHSSFAVLSFWHRIVCHSLIIVALLFFLFDIVLSATMIKEWQTIRCQKERTAKLLWSKNDRQYDVKKKEQQSYYDQRMTDNTMSKRNNNKATLCCFLFLTSYCLVILWS
jgi:hypothetical protein